jgi:hypothetical protein
MKIKLVNTCMVLLLISIFSFGQNDKQLVNEMDSIQQLLNDDQKENEEHVRMLNELARLYFYNDQAKYMTKIYSSF